jgi:nitroimidazol reductase NimA-like FMN-containing flavoprotein (pyridoxamine 5'-phosphate oxidase superfamily)
MKADAPPRQRRPLLRSECLELLALAPRGRVALSDRALPIIVPVSYRLVGDAIEIEATGRILTNAGAKGHVVCFEADSSGPDEDWSVVVIGKLRASTSAEFDPTLHLVTTMMNGRRWSKQRRQEPAHSGTSDPGRWLISDG